MNRKHTLVLIIIFISRGPIVAAFTKNHYINGASACMVAGSALSCYQGHKKLAALCGAGAIISRYIAHSMQKSTPCIPEEDYPKKVYTMPKSLEDPEWKRLFALTTASNSVPKALMVLAQQRLARNIDDDKAFFTRVAEIVGPALQRVELLERRAYPANPFNGERELVVLKKPHSNFYPIGIMSSDSEHEHEYCTAFLPAVRGSGGELRRELCINIRERSKEHLSNITDIYHDISAFAHEMVHAARIDGFYANKRERERQADFLSGLALRSDDFFLGRLYGFIRLFNASELIRYHAAKNNTYALAQLLVERANDGFSSAYIKEALLDRHNYYCKDFTERLKILRSDLLMDLIVANIKENDAAESTHPPMFERIQNNLTAWAAFLIHIKKMRQNAAIDHIAKLSRTLHGKFYQDQGFEATEQIVGDWKSIHRKPLHYLFYFEW